MRSFRRLLLVLGSVLIATGANGADIAWYSFIADPAGADAGFVDLLESAGHNVTRFAEVTPLGASDIDALNAADLVITSRSVNSGGFDGTNAPIWNEQITTPMIALSAYIVRQNRLGWFAGSDVPDSGPTPLVADDPNHFIFNGIDFAADGVTMANDYNVMIDRGTSTIANMPIAGGTVLATNPSVAGGVAIAEFPAGTTVTDEAGVMMTLAAPRYFFAAGSREADGSGVATAGVLDLTADGERLLVNTVNYALGIPEPSTWILSVMVFSGLLLLTKRK